MNITAPNSYSVPSLMGACKEGNHSSAPSFTMSARAREAEDKMKVPGPGTYNEAQVDNYKTLKSPAFSMGQRTLIPSDHTMKPGPGAHSPEKVCDFNYISYFTLNLAFLCLFIYNYSYEVILFKFLT